MSTFTRSLNKWVMKDSDPSRTKSPQSSFSSLCFFFWSTTFSLSVFERSESRLWTLWFFMLSTALTEFWMNCMNPFLIFSACVFLLFVVNVKFLGRFFSKAVLISSKAFSKSMMILKEPNTLKWSDRKCLRRSVLCRLRNIGDFFLNRQSKATSLLFESCNSNTGRRLAVWCGVASSCWKTAFDQLERRHRS